MAQVSTGTVDRVLHQRGEVSEKTRKKVELILKELDYQPDIMARTLATKKTWLFAVIMPVSANGHDFWHSPNRGIDKAMSEIEAFGVRVRRFFFDQFDKQSFLKSAEKLFEYKPDAVLFAPVFPDESINFIKECSLRTIPVLLFNSSLDELSDVCYIGQDSLQSGYLAARLLTYCKNPEGFFLILNLAGRKENHNHILRRERGFRKYFVENSSGAFELQTISLDQPSEEELTAILQDEFSRHKIDGIFVTNSKVYNAASFLQNKGIRSVRLIGYDLLPENINFLKAGTIDFLISQKPEEQGYRGIMTLFNKTVLNKKVEIVQYISIDIINRDNINFYDFR